MLLIDLLYVEDAVNGYGNGSGNSSSLAELASALETYLEDYLNGTSSKDGAEGEEDKGDGKQQQSMKRGRR